MALTGLFAAPPGSPSGTPTTGGLKGTFAAPPAPVSQLTIDHGNQEADFIAQQQQAQQEAQKQNSLGGIIAGAIPNFGDIIGGARKVGSDIFSAFTKPVAPSVTPDSAFQSNKPVAPGSGTDITLAAANNFASTAEDTAHRISTMASTVANDHATALQKGVSVGEAGIGALNSLFSPVSAFLAGASHIPVLGGIANGINNIFNAVGTGGADVAEALVDALPLSQETKDTLQPLAKEIGGLAALIIAGKASGETFNTVADKTKTFIDTVNGAVKGGQYVASAPEMTKLPVKGESTETTIPNANEYTAPDQLPTIPVGPKAPELPTIESSPADTALPKVPGLTYEPTKDTGTVTRETNVPQPSEEPVAPLKPRTGAVKPVEGTGDTQTRSLAQGIEAKAIENGLTDTFGQLPEYKSVSMADQAAKASDLINKDYEAAKDIALGKKAPPSGVLPESVLVAVEKKAIAEGDVETLRQLAVNSHLSYEATTMGQRIRTLAERDPTSPVGAIKAVQDARAEALKGKKVDVTKETERVVDEIRGSIRKARSARPTWEEFVQKLTCNV